MTSQGGKRRAPRVATLRRRALDAARALLTEQGPDALQLRVLAAQIGSAVGSLYYHFKDKDALLAALAIEGFRELSAYIQRGMDRKRAGHDIDAASAAYLRFMERNLALYTLMHDPQIMARSEAVRQAEHAAFNVFLSALQKDERVPAEHAENIALVVWLLARGLGSGILTHGIKNPDAIRELRTKVLTGFARLISPSFRA